MFDFIIVGGRPAGASLAIRLGRAGLRVLVLERAPMPSWPAASSPAINPAALELLDAVGADETAYARATPRIPRWVLGHRDDWAVAIPMPERAGRAYGYGIDRARLDAELWRVAAATPNVTVRDRCGVTDLWWEGAQVVGIVAQGEKIRAPLVVGADGRFSLVARKVGAALHDEHPAHPTSIFYAYWENVAPCADGGGPAFHMLNSGKGFGLLVMESADGTAAVTVEGQMARLAGGAAHYEPLLRGEPYVWQRLAGARRVTDVRGMKNIGNGYRPAGGPGWALVGDAVHQKDPLDGQGIYDALLSAHLLAEAIVNWHSGAETWPAACGRYATALVAATRPMYQATLTRVQRELYTAFPAWFIRWLGQDADYQRRFALLHTRQIALPDWLPHRVTLGAVGRGFWRAVRRRVTAF